MPRRCSGKTADELPTWPYATWDWIERTFTTRRDGRTPGTSALDGAHLERAEPRRVGQQVDRGDAAVGDGEREHHPRPDDTATTEIYTLSLTTLFRSRWSPYHLQLVAGGRAHDALDLVGQPQAGGGV